MYLDFNPATTKQDRSSDQSNDIKPCSKLESLEQKTVSLPVFPAEDYECMVGAFRAIAKMPTQLQRKFWLVKVAPILGLPRSKYRRLYEVWCAEGGMQ